MQVIKYYIFVFISLKIYIPTIYMSIVIFFKYVCIKYIK
jgi:hypothetical protein